MWLEQPGQRGGVQVGQRRTEYPLGRISNLAEAPRNTVFQCLKSKVMSKCDSKFGYTCEKGRSRCRLEFCIQNNGLLAGAQVACHVLENKNER